MAPQGGPRGGQGRSRAAQAARTGRGGIGGVACGVRVMAGLLMRPGRPAIATRWAPTRCSSCSPGATSSSWPSWCSPGADDRHQVGADQVQQLQPGRDLEQLADQVRGRDRQQLRKHTNRTQTQTPDPGPIDRPAGRADDQAGARPAGHQVFDQANGTPARAPAWVAHRFPTGTGTPGYAGKAEDQKPRNPDMQLTHISASDNGRPPGWRPRFSGVCGMESSGRRVPRGRGISASVNGRQAPEAPAAQRQG
jgi:hypothetical protein